jgi:hypothetical protein
MKIQTLIETLQAGIQSGAVGGACADAVGQLTAAVQELADFLTQAKTEALAALASNNAEVETIRANTKTAITAAAQYLQALTETELSEAQQAAVSGLGGVIAFASKSEIQRQYDAAQSALVEAQRVADELAAQLS